MASKDKERIEDPLLDLVKTLRALAESSKDRLETYRELVDHEWIPEDMFERLILNERLGLIAEMDNLLDYYRGMN